MLPRRRGRASTGEAICGFAAWLAVRPTRASIFSGPLSAVAGAGAAAGSCAPAGAAAALARTRCFLSRVRRNHADGDILHALDAPVPGALLDLGELAAKPHMVGGSVKNEDAVADLEIFLVETPNLRFVSLEGWVNDLHVLEQVIGPRRNHRVVTLVVHEVHRWRRLPGAVRTVPARARQ
jgi:hypothetical protein